MIEFFWQLWILYATRKWFFFFFVSFWFVLAKVPGCIDKLAQGGIKICVLTGDKMETTISIGLLRQGMKQIVVNLESPHFKGLEKMEDKAAISKGTLTYLETYLKVNQQMKMR